MGFKAAWEFCFFCSSLGAAAFLLVLGVGTGLAAPALRSAEGWGSGVCDGVGTRATALASVAACCCGALPGPRMTIMAATASAAKIPTETRAAITLPVERLTAAAAWGTIGAAASAPFRTGSGWAYSEACPEAYDGAYSGEAVVGLGAGSIATVLKEPSSWSVMVTVFRLLPPEGSVTSIS